MSRRQARSLQGTFGGNLRAARRNAGLTQEGLARELNATLRSVQRWEADQVEPSGRLLLRMAAVLNVDAAVLFPEERSKA